SSRPPPGPGSRGSSSDRKRRRQGARGPRAPDRSGRCRAHARRPRALAGPAAGRYPHRARQLLVLLSARDVARAERRPHAAPLSRRPPMSRLLAAAALMALSSAPIAPVAPTSDTIRVAIVENARTAEIRGAGIEVSELGCAACQGRVWRTDAVKAARTGQGVEIDGRGAQGFRLTSDSPIRINGREYPAIIEVVKTGEGLAIVNVLRLEEYLVGVLRAETSDKWPGETLRPKAIAARTYAAYHRSLNGAKPYHIVASTTHQMYTGVVPPSSPLWA